MYQPETTRRSLTPLFLDIERSHENLTIPDLSEWLFFCQSSSPENTAQYLLLCDLHFPNWCSHRETQRAESFRSVPCHYARHTHPISLTQWAKRPRVTCRTLSECSTDWRYERGSGRSWAHRFPAGQGENLWSGGSRLHSTPSLSGLAPWQSARQGAESHGNHAM